MSTSEIQVVQKQLESALAVAHAALEEMSRSSDYQIAQARYRAAVVLPKVSAMRPQLALADAHRLFRSVRQLRAVLRVLDRQLEARGRN